MIHIWPDNIGYERMDTSYKACGENMLKEQKDWILEIVKKIMIKEILSIIIWYHIKSF